MGSSSLEELSRFARNGSYNTSWYNAQSNDASAQVFSEASDMMFPPSNRWN